MDKRALIGKVDGAELSKGHVRCPRCTNCRRCGGTGEVAAFMMGDRLRVSRERCGLGLREAAKQARISPTTLSHIERNKANTTMEKVVRLASLYGVSLDWLADRAALKASEGGGG